MFSGMHHNCRYRAYHVLEILKPRVRVLYVPPSCTVDRTVSGKATEKVAFPGAMLSSGMGTGVTQEGIAGHD